MCGQRVLPADATLRDLAHDAWDELAGFDGRFARTLRLLLRRPGHLTTEVLDGRRNRYISPIRLYLFASFAFFLIAALAPPLARGGGPRASISADGTEQVIELDAAELISAEDRAAGLKQLERAPWWASMILRPIFTDPVGFRTRLSENVPRVLFVLVPIFALAIGLFFRGGWLQHAIFSLHLHAAVFLILVPRELARFTGNLYVLGATELACLVAAASYTLTAIKHVYQERWPRLLLKMIPVTLVYLVAYAIAMLAALTWTATQ
jgi:hypothetical protein